MLRGAGYCWPVVSGEASCACVPLLRIQAGCCAWLYNMWHFQDVHQRVDPGLMQIVSRGRLWL
jgi:hypothetical protein